MGSRFPSHQLSNGLYVSGHPEQPKEKVVATMCATAVPYTGGDINKSGDLGKMFLTNPKPTSHSGPVAIPNSNPNSTGRSGPISTVVPFIKSYSGPLSKHGEPIPIRRVSGPQPGRVTPTSGSQSPILPVTGLIVSGPLTSSGPLRNLDSAGPTKSCAAAVTNNPAVTAIGREDGHTFRKKLIPRPILWVVVLLFMMAFVASGFILGAVHNATLLVAVAALFGLFTVLFTWNFCHGEKAFIRYVAKRPDSELRTAKNGDYVKISGVVTCGTVPLKTSFQKIPRCVYTSTSLYEYRGWNAEPANSTHPRFTWGLKVSEKQAVDFYISDFQSGLRALVKAGNGAQVIPYVEDSVTVEVDTRKEEASAEMVQWLGERRIWSENRRMRLKEGYIKEGSTVSVMGVVKRDENVVMIAAPDPEEGATTACQWGRCIFPVTYQGVVIASHTLHTSDQDVIPV